MYVLYFTKEGSDPCILGRSQMVRTFSDLRSHILIFKTVHIKLYSYD